MTTKRIPAAERRKQFMKYVSEGKVDDGYYVIDNGKGVHKCDACTQTEVEGT